MEEGPEGPEKGQGAQEGGGGRVWAAASWALNLNLNLTRALNLTFDP